MKICKININGFRNLKEVEIDFTKPITILVGQNGHGKTNILESVMLVSRGMSFRTRNAREQIVFGGDWFRISAISEDHHEINYGAQLTPGGIIKKSLKYDTVDISTKELAGLIPSVIFLPTELDMFTGSPSIRRNVMNSSLIQTDKGYYDDLANLNHIVKCRNKLLKSIRDGYSKREELTYWNSELVAVNDRIGLKRLEFAEHLSELMEDIYNQIAGTQNTISIDYKPTTDLAGHLEASISKEIILAQTLKGPHREDFTVKLNLQELKSFGSRGEHRTAVLALKIAEIKYLKEKLSTDPILLLDDVMSELDKNRQIQLLENITDIQTIITTTDATLFPELETCQVIEIANGRQAN